MKKQTKRTTKPSRKKMREQNASELQQTLARLGGFGLLAALLTVIVMMVAAQFFPDMAILNVPRQWIARVITPVQTAFSGLTDGAVSYFRNLKFQGNLQAEYEKVVQQLDEAANRTLLYEELLRTMEQYADASDELERNRNLDGVRATIIGRDTSNYNYVVTVNVGSDQGITDGMAVVHSGALVGIVDGVERDSAKVRAIVDSNASVHALIETSRDQGQVRGTLAIDGTYACRMYYLTYTTLPRPGDRVITSGMGLAFPKGIPIGTVRESTRGLEDSKQFIVVEPFVDFNHLEYVIIFRYLPAVAEPADVRGMQASSTFVPLPSIVPVPTLIGQAPPELTPGPDGVIPTTATPSPSPTPSPTPSPAPTMDPNATPIPESYAYNVKPPEDVTPSPEPSPTPTPSPVPAPTFSVDQVTVEEDE